jgi:hypothetical protein
MRKSLANQSVQDFKILTLVDKSAVDKFKKGKLDNETIIPVEGKFPECRIGIKEAVKPYITEDRVIITRLDIDDEIPTHFIEAIQHELSQHMPEFAVDIYDLIQKRTDTGETQTISKYHSMSSPFISTIERKPHPILPYSVNNEEIKNIVNGVKLTNLFAIQNITGRNKLNKWSV